MGQTQTETEQAVCANIVVHDQIVVGDFNLMDIAVIMIIANEVRNAMTSFAHFVSNTHEEIIKERNIDFQALRWLENEMNWIEWMNVEICMMTVSMTA